MVAMRSSVCRLNKLLLFVPGTLLAPCNATAQPDTVVLAAEQAWTVRQGKLNRFHIEWEQQVTAFKGSRTESFERNGKPRSTFPPTDRTYTETASLIMESEKICYEQHGKVLHMEKADWVDDNYKVTFDGKAGLYFRGESNGDFNTATHTSNQVPHQFRSTQVMAVLQACRPIDRQLAAFDLSSYRASGRRLTIRGKECVELVLRPKAASVGSSIWLDAARDYILVRRQTTYSDRTERYSSEQLDIDYQEVKPGLWLPRQWIEVKNGWTIPVLFRKVATVTKVEVDTKTRVGQFDTVPPPKTLVHEVDGASHSRHIVRPDGSKGSFDVKNSDSGFREMMGLSPPNEASWWRRNRILLGSVLGAVVLGVVTLALRRRRVIAQARS